MMTRQRAKWFGLSAALWVIVPVGAAHAVDALTGASKREHRAGTPETGIWITGRGFVAGLSVSVSGDGVLASERPLIVVPQAERADGGQGDAIAFYFGLAPNATLGPRDLTVTGPGGESRTGVGFIEVIAGEAPPPPDNPPPDNPPPDNPPPDGPPPAPDRVDVITRASPRAGGQGEQVNLWIAGRSFPAGVQVKFSNPGLGPASFQGRALVHEVVRNAESERRVVNGQETWADGIQFYLRIDPEAPLGPVDITVTAPDGASSAVGAGLFEVLEPGGVPAPLPGDGNVDAITGASPRVVRQGRHVSVWLYGLGFANGAEVTIGHPGVQPYAPPEVVERATSQPGHAGIRTFLVIDDDAAPGTIPITVTNPNGTTTTADGLVEIIDRAGRPGGGDAVIEPGPGGGDGGDGGGGPCPDEVTVIESVDSVTPAEAARGDTVDLVISGRAFACGARVLIHGGGLAQDGPPRLVRDPLDPAATEMHWRIMIGETAAVGQREITVVNPNGSAKKLRQGLNILPAPGSLGKSRNVGSGCTAAVDAGGGAPGTTGALVALLLLGFARRRR